MHLPFVPMTSWQIQRASVKPENTQPFYNNCYVCLAMLTKSVFNLLQKKPLYLTIQRQLFLKFPNSLAALSSARSSYLFQPYQTMPKTEENKKRLYMSLMLAER